MRRTISMIVTEAPVTVETEETATLLDVLRTSWPRPPDATRSNSHRDRGAYCAVVCELHVDQEVRLDHLWCVTDCELVINPDGARNQLEGGMVMAASWALKEQVKLGGTGIVSTTWSDYPILRFGEVPPIDGELVEMPESPPWGTGEISQGAAMAAIGKALAQALGARIRDMPFTRERISEALLRE